MIQNLDYLDGFAQADKAYKFLNWCRDNYTYQLGLCTNPYVVIQETRKIEQIILRH